MTNTEELNKIIQESGYTKSFLAKQLGISLYAFQMKRENKSQFTAEEIKILCHWLKIKTLRRMNNIFFTEVVDKSSTESEE